MKEGLTVAEHETIETDQFSADHVTEVFNELMLDVGKILSEYEGRFINLGNKRQTVEKKGATSHRLRSQPFLTETLSHSLMVR